MKTPEIRFIALVCTLTSACVAQIKPDAINRAGLLAPARVHYSAYSPAHLRVEWTDNASNEAGYRIWRREPGGEWYLAGEAPADATHFDDGGMQADTAYEHQVAAFDLQGESARITTNEAGRTLKMMDHLSPQIVVPEGSMLASVPSAIELRDGTLFLVCSALETANRQRQINRGLWQLRSTDGGRNWTQLRVLIAGDKKDSYGKAALLRLPDGRLGLSYSRFGLDATGRIVDRERKIIFSSDEAETWSEPVGMGAYSANNDTMIVADSGRILQALSGLTPAARIVASDDQGATWRTLADVSAREEARPTGEAALAYVGAGRLVFISRHEAPFQCLALSNDNGDTWSPSGILYLGGGDNPPKLVRLPGTNIVAAIIHSWYPGKKSKDRRQLASVISRDGGRTWDNFRLIGHSPDGSDGFLQHSITFIGDTGFLFFGGGSPRDTNDGKDLRLIRLSKDFFTSTVPWPYDWQGLPLNPGPVSAPTGRK